MFDIDVSKMAVIGMVALVVLGPQRLPRVARTAGTLLGRAQRYLNSVRTEVDQQIRLDELRNMKSSVEQAVANVQDTVDRTVRQHAGELPAGVDAVAVSLNDAVPTAYLPSVHEGTGDVQADLFKVRPARSQESGQFNASIHLSRPETVASKTPAFVDQQTRARWRGWVSGRRGSAVRRTRVVSMAASKALGRNGARVA